MQARLDYGAAAPEALKRMLEMERYVRGSGIDPSLLHLIKLRASQMNGCAYCVDMHSQDAAASGERAERLHGVAVWRDSPFYTDRERIALAWTEAVTALSSEGVPDALWARASATFSEKELVDLTMAIVAINGWNRISVAFRPPVGVYRPGSGERV